MTEITAARLRMMRAAAGITQEELTERTGIPQPHISRAERGGNISARTLERLEAALAGWPAIVPHGAAPRWRGQGSAPEPGRLELIDLGIETEETDWLVSGTVARGAVTMIAGAPGAGKSLLSQAVAGRAASGGGWVADGLDVQGGHVWIVDAENGPDVIRRRLARFFAPGTASRLHVQAAIGWDMEAGQPALLEAMRKAPDCDYLILDSWASLWTSGSMYNAEAVRACLGGLREIAKEVGVGVLLIHHTTKGTTTYLGSGAAAATVEAVFTLTRPTAKQQEERWGGDGNWPEDADAYRVLRCEKMRLDAEPDTQWINIRRLLG